MGTFVFWGIFAVVIILAFISSKRAVNAKKLSILNSFSQKGSSDYSCRKDYNTLKNESCFYNAMNDHNLREVIFEDDNCINVDAITVYDLEIDDLFCRMDRCVTSVGSEVLRERLLHQISAKEASRFNELSDYLSSNGEIEKYIPALIDLGKINGVGVFEVLKKLLKAKPYKYGKYIISDCLLLASILIIFVNPMLGAALLLIMMAVCVTMHFKEKEKMDELLSSFRYLLKMINSYEKLKDSLKENEEFSYLFEDIDDMSSLSKGAFWLPKGASLTSNPVDIILDYVRMLLSVDIILFSKRISDIKKYEKSIYRLYYCVGIIDSALALYKYKESLICYCDTNTAHDNANTIMIEGIYHPFLENPVLNDITLSKDILLTGSNASGKSTFIKAVGLCVITMQSFGFAPAKTYLAPWVEVMTSMALRDDIRKGESYYIVEAKSLKRIIDNTYSDHYVLCILDEILKGTNTTERIASSFGVLKSFIKDNVFVLAATHDYELTTMLNQYEKYYFTEEIENNRVIFPYRIHKGVKAGKNAIKLLDILGFSKDIVNTASDMADLFEKNGKWEA